MKKFKHVMFLSVNAKFVFQKNNKLIINCQKICLFFMKMSFYDLFIDLFILKYLYKVLEFEKKKKLCVMCVIHLRTNFTRINPPITKVIAKITLKLKINYQKK